jgi:hypothetical protein
VVMPCAGMVPPGFLLVAFLVLTLTVLVAESVRQNRQAEAVRRLAGRWRMNFGRRDTLRLTARVARAFPVPGAAALRVFHIAYGTEGDRYRYVFTTQYTLGVTGPKVRHTRVAAFDEPRDRRGGAGDDAGTLVLAEEGLTLLEQYESLGPAVADGDGTSPLSGEVSGDEAGGNAPPGE